MLLNVRRSVIFLFVGLLALPALAQEADREWIPFEDPDASAVQTTNAVAKAKPVMTQ